MAEMTDANTSASSWGTGLHSQLDEGSVDVGLSVEPGAVGLIVDAPHLGLLQLAFAVSSDGTTRLTRASRRLTDGRDAKLIAVDEAKIEALEERVLALTAQRDEARDQTKTTAAERDQWSTDCEAARAEAARARAELGAGSVTLMRELNEAREAREAAQAQCSDLTAKLSDLAARVEQQKREAEKTKEEIGMLVAALSDARSFQHDAEATNTELEAAVNALKQDLEASRARIADGELRAAQLQEEHSVALADLAASRDAALAQVDRAHQSTQESVADAQAQAVVARAERDRLATQWDAAQAHHQTALAALHQQISNEREAARVARAQLETEVEALHSAIQVQGNTGTAAAKDAHDLAERLKAQADILRKERDEARLLARQLHQKLSAPPDGRELTELRSALALERQATTKALTERDEWQSRFRDLAAGAAEVTRPEDTSREVTRSYSLDQHADSDTPTNPSADYPTVPIVPDKGQR